MNEILFQKKYKNTGHLYIGKKEFHGNIYKIGRTKDIDNRLKNHILDNGEQFHYIYLSNLLFNYVDAEMFILNKLSNPILGQEWFELKQLEVEVLVCEIKQLEKESYRLFEQEHWEKDLDEEFDYERCY